MKKTHIRIITLVLALVMLSTIFVSCSAPATQPTTTDETTNNETPDTTTPADDGKTDDTQDQPKKTWKVSLGNSLLGNILAFIADDKGYFAEEGIEPEFMTFQSSADGLNAILNGSLDIGMIYGCAYPLLYMTQGADFTIFGGYMSGGFPVVAFPGTFEGGYKGMESYVGKTIALARNYTPDLVWYIAMKDAGYVEGEDFEIIYGSNQSETLQMVLSGKADVTLAAWSQYTAVLEAGLEIYDWSGYLWDHTHVCCRLVANEAWIQEDPERCKAFLRAMIKAEKIHDEDPEYVKQLWMDLNGFTEEQAHAIVYDIPSDIEIDPKANGVRYWWDKLQEIDFLEAGDINVYDRINIELYKEVLDELTAENPNDAFYQKLQARFTDYNSEMLAE